MSGELTIRLSDGCEKDVDAIEDLEMLCFHYPWSRDSIIRGMNEAPLAMFFVAETAGKIAGYVSCWIIPPYECQIGNLAVHPDFRRQHIAEKLMERVLKETEKRGIPDATLEVRVSNLAAIALYKKLGFESEGIRKKYYQGIEDAMIMWRREKPAAPVSAPSLTE